MLSGATDVAAIASLVEEFPQTAVRFLPSLHAKVFISDGREAVVTSSNLTENGLRRNFEYGVQFTDPSEVARVRSDILAYGQLASPVTLHELRVFALATKELRSLRARAEASLRQSIRAQFELTLAAMDEAVLRARAGERSLASILADAIVYLLRDGPMTTQQIHFAVQRIHPDLCDDSVDRVIDGRRFGKKWKHAVRTAQQHLKQRGRIRYESAQWMLTEWRPKA